jgi:predicted HTH domain antitoxin
MTTLTITIPEELSAELAPYRDSLDELLRIGLREVKMEQSLSLFKKGDISLWRAARLADVSLREMISYAVAQGIHPPVDDETIQEELA